MSAPTEIEILRAQVEGAAACGADAGGGSVREPRLALLFHDGSMEVFSPSKTVEQARADRNYCDIGERHENKMTRIVRIAFDIVETIDNAATERQEACPTCGRHS